MKILALAAVAAFAFSGTASAQLAHGRSGMSSSEQLSNVRAFSDLRHFGRCFAQTERRVALTVIATVPDSPEEREAFDRFVFGERENCLFGGTDMAMPILYMRGAIAEGLLHSGGVPDTYRLSAPTPAEVHNLHDVARCFTAGHRAQVEALLETEAGSRQETAAVAALWNDFRACMPGVSVRLNAPWIRFLLAEALLRTAPDAAASS